MRETEKIIIFDTTLRDGEQSPGASMTLDEKLRLAQTLEDMGVDVIEAGFPAASKGDFLAVHTIAKNAKTPVICALARAKVADIEHAAKALQPAEKRRIHTFISTSPLHMRSKLQMSAEEVLEAVGDSVTLARRYSDNVEWSPEDASRSNHDFLCRCVERAIQSGATTINIPDTVGYNLPDEFAGLFTMLRRRVPNIDKAVLSAHCHDDLGLATANSLGAILAGARQVECTINGLGERAGNAAMEEIVMLLHTRTDMAPYHTDIKTEKIAQASRLVSAITGFPVQPNKAIVGRNAFAHEAGIHQDGMIKDARTYEIMTPESIGLKRSNLVLGKHSGRNAFKRKLDDLGYVDIPPDHVEDAFLRFKDLADRKKEIFDEDIMAIVDDEVMRDNDRARFVSLRIRSDSDKGQQADIVVTVDGKQRRHSAVGSGSIDALFRASAKALDCHARLALYRVDAISGGTDAQAQVMVKLEDGDKSAFGRGADADTLCASARAYINAFNGLLMKGSKSSSSVKSEQRPTLRGI